jgi:hypothetical protein
MPDAGHGFATAVTGVVTGLIVETVLRSFVSVGLLSPLVMMAYQLGNILAILTFVHVTRYWGTFYLFGWWFGLGIMWCGGLVGDLEFIIDSIVLGFVLITRVLRRISD